MKLMFLVPIAASFFVTAAQAQRQNCHHDPVCQAKRDGISVSAARARGARESRCLSKAGFTMAQWERYEVPGVYADGIRACLASTR